MAKYDIHTPAQSAEVFRWIRNYGEVRDHLENKDTKILAASNKVEVEAPPTPKPQVAPKAPAPHKTEVPKTETKTPQSPQAPSQVNSANVDDVD